MPSLVIEDKFTTGGTWNTSNGTPTIVDSPAPPSGGKALEVNNTNEYVFWTIPDSGYTRLVLGCWFRAAAWPATDTRVFKIDPNPTEGWAIYRTNGEWAARSDGTPSIAQFFQTSSLAIDTWRWMQIMYDVGSDPWELRLKNGSAAAVAGTGAAAATNLNPGILLLGTTAAGSVFTRYYGHFKVGVAADDDDWWPEPSLAVGYQRLVGPQLLSNSAATLYTVPTGMRATIRHVYINNPTGSSVAARLSIGTDAAGTRFVEESVAAGREYDSRRSTFRTLEAGEIIQGFADTASAVTVLIDGYLEQVD